MNYQKRRFNYEKICTNWGGGRFLSFSNAFTLAELLITLGIIGVVAALTLPTLITNYKNKEYATRAKRTYSLINQAIQKYQADAGVAGDVSGLFDTSKTSAEVLTNFSKYFDGAKICLNSSGECRKYTYSILYNYPLYSPDMTAINANMNYPLIVLKDSSIMQITQYSSCERELSSPAYNPDGTTKVDADGNPIINHWTSYDCAEIKFDTNGTAKPNQFGADVFVLLVYNDATLSGAKSTGFTSLQGILSGKDPEYTKYSAGSKKE